MGVFDKEQKEPLFIAMRDDDTTLANAVKRAKETLPYFRKAFAKPQYRHACFMAKTLFVDTGEAGTGAVVWKAHFAAGYAGRPTAHIWLRVNDVLEDLLFCSTFEAPESFGSLGAGQSFVLTPDDTEDWMINQNGRLYGGLSLRLQRSIIPASDRDGFDRYAGITEYSDEMP
jgi:uncharacterized protein YegJ (DUF2314 family)